MIKGALFDIDDTLFSHKIKAVPTLSLKAIDELKKKGIKIGVCTSRRSAEMAGMPKELLDRLDCQITSTGAVTLVNDEYYKAYSIDIELAKKYTQFFDENNISYDYCDINGDCYFYGDKALITEKKYLHLTKGNIMYKKYEDEEITGICFYNDSQEIAEKVKKIKEDQYISWWGKSGIIGPELVDKSFGLMKFCQMFSLTTDEVIAFGDGSNDDLMLQMAGIGVAVNDGNEHTKQVADYICKKSIEDGGIYEALIELKIIEQGEYHPKIFFFDIDSTTFDHSIDKVREKTYEALQKLKSKGYKLCINTSRSHEEMYNVPEKLLSMMDCVIMLSGSYIVKDGKVYIKYMNEEDVQKCIKYLDDNNVTYRYCLDNGTGYLNKNDTEKENLFYSLYGMVPKIKKYENEKILQILFYITEEKRRTLMGMMINSEFSFLKLGGEFYPKNVDKGFSLEEITKMYGLSQNDTCAFGDGDNDCTMLQKANLGIAMGNGTKMCKQSADYITDDISDEGLYNALIHFGIIEE